MTYINPLTTKCSECVHCICATYPNEVDKYYCGLVSLEDPSDPEDCFTEAEIQEEYPCVKYIPKIN